MLAPRLFVHKNLGTRFKPLRFHQLAAQFAAGVRRGVNIDVPETVFRVGQRGPGLERTRKGAAFAAIRREVADVGRISALQTTVANRSATMHGNAPICAVGHVLIRVNALRSNL
jgi:hypothetical protein